MVKIMKKQLKVMSFTLALLCAVIWVPGARADYIPGNIDQIVSGIEGMNHQNGNDTGNQETVNKGDDTVDTSADFVEESTFADATVNVYQLNMRSGPSTSYNIIHVLSQNETLKVFGKIDGWYIVQDTKDGTVGCVSGYYITLSNGSRPDNSIGNTGNNGTPNGNYGNNGNAGNNNGTFSEEETLLSMINELRHQNGLPPLTLNAELSRVALHKAMDMVENNYFSHQSPTYGSPFEMMKKYGIVFTAAAENIAGNQTVEGAVYSWKNSEGHLANILSSKYTETGIGIYTSPIYGKVFVQMFKG